MNRRGFLRSLLSGTAGAIAAHTLDLDRLLWVPGERTIFLPPLEGWNAGNTLITPDWVIQETLRIFENNLKFSAVVNRTYDDSFTVGDVVTIRNPVRTQPLRFVHA